MRLERAINHFEKTLSHFEKNIDKRLSEIDKRFTESELRMEKAINRNLIATVSIIGGLMAILQTVLTFAHGMLH